MAPSTKRIRVYHDSAASTSRDDVRASLGVDSWVRQFPVEVVATSKAEAEQIMEMHRLFVGHNGLMVDGRVDTEHGDTLNSHAEALRAAGLLTPEHVGACYAHSAQGGHGAVVDVTAADAPATGYLVPRQRGYGYDYRPAQQTDRLRAAVERLHGLAPTLPDADRDALRLVLAAARTTLPAEEN